MGAFTATLAWLLLARACTVAAQVSAIVDPKMAKPSVNCGRRVTPADVNFDITSKAVPSKKAQAYGFTLSFTTPTGKTCYVTGLKRTPFTPNRKPLWQIVGFGKFKWTDSQLMYADVGRSPYTQGLNWESTPCLYQNKLKCGTSYHATVAYFERTYGSMVVKSDRAATSPSSTLADVLTYPNTYQDRMTADVPIRCSTAKCGSPTPDLMPVVLTGLGGGWLGPPIVTASSVTQTTATIDFAVKPWNGDNPYLSVFLWKSGAAPGTPVCQFNWRGKGLEVPNSLTSPTRVTVGAQGGFRSRGWTSMYWSGAVPACAKAALRCGTAYRLLVYAEYDNNVYGFSTFTKVITFTTRGC